MYEEANVENADGDGTSYEQGMSALSSLDRVQQVELIAGYNDMKENLVEYLRKFGSNKVEYTPEIYVLCCLHVLLVLNVLTYKLFTYVWCFM